MVFCIAVVFKIRFVGCIEETSPRNCTRSRAIALAPRSINLCEAQTAREAKLFTEAAPDATISVLDRVSTRQDCSIEAEILCQLVNFPEETQIYDHPATKVSKTHGHDAKGAKDCPDFARAKFEPLSP